METRRYRLETGIVTPNIKETPNYIIENKEQKMAVRN